MGLTLTQLKDYVSGVLRGWFINKPTLDKLYEDNKQLMYNGHQVVLLDNQCTTLYEDNQIFKRGAGHQVCNLIGNVRDFNRIKIFWEDNNSNHYCHEMLKSSSNDFSYYSFNFENICIKENSFYCTPVLIVGDYNLLVLQETDEYHISDNKFIKNEFESSSITISTQSIMSESYGVNLYGADWARSTKIDSDAVKIYENCDGYYITGNENPHPSEGQIPTSGCYITFRLITDCKITIREKTKANHTFYVVDENKNILVSKTAGDTDSYDNIEFNAVSGVMYYAYIDSAIATIFNITFDTIKPRLAHINRIEGYKY